MSGVERSKDSVDEQEVRADRREIGLPERGGTESRRRGPAEDELLGRFDSRRDLEVRRVAEVGVVLESPGDPEPEELQDVRLEVDVSGIAVARRVPLVGRTEAREDLRARGLATAELVGVAAVDPRSLLARVLLVVLPPD